MPMNVGSILALGILLISCAPVQMRCQIDRPPGEYYASVGDVILRVQRG
jgi:hypothetical protein